MGIESLVREAALRRFPAHRLLLAAGLLCVAALWGCGGAAPVRLPAEPTYALEGAVSAGGSPLTRASVMIEGTPRGFMVDGNGSFVIDHLRAGRHRVIVIHLGLSTDPVAIEVPAIGETRLELPLKHDPKLGEALADVESVTLVFSVTGAR